MDSLIHADFFFFISSIFFILASILVVMIIYYLKETLANFRDVSRSLKKGVKEAGENVEEIFEDVEESRIYRFIFGGRRKAKHKSKKS